MLGGWERSMADFLAFLMTCLRITAKVICIVAAFFMAFIWACIRGGRK